MSSQQLANEALAIFQAHRSAPREVVEAMLAEFFSPPVETEAEFEVTLNKVRECMR